MRVHGTRYVRIYRPALPCMDSRIGETTCRCLHTAVVPTRHLYLLREKTCVHKLRIVGPFSLESFINNTQDSKQPTVSSPLSASGAKEAHGSCAYANKCWVDTKTFKTAEPNEPMRGPQFKKFHLRLELQYCKCECTPPPYIASRHRFQKSQHAGSPVMSSVLSYIPSLSHSLVDFRSAFKSVVKKLSAACCVRGTRKRRERTTKTSKLFASAARYQPQPTFEDTPPNMEMWP